jgi:hypothetical protein
MLTPVCLLQLLEEKKFQSLRRNQNNLVESEDNNGLSNDEAIAEDNANNGRNNVEKMLLHCMMLHGLESLSLMLEQALLLDLQKNL